MNPKLAAAIVLAGITLACSQSAPTHDSAADIAAINQIREQEIAAFAAGQPDALAALFTEDAVILPPDEARLDGRAAIRSWAQGVADQFTVKGGYAGSEVKVAGDWAIETYTGFLAVTPKKGGKAVEERLRGIHVYRRQADGSWRIAEDIWNNEPPPAAK